MVFILKNHANFKVIAKLYLNDELADVHFVFNLSGAIDKVPANKSILAALSPVFYKMFYGDLKEGSNVEIVDASAEAFEEFLQFFYLDEIRLRMENIEAVARLADKYDILEHVTACATFLKSQLTVNNMCWGYQLAVFLQRKPLISFCESEIIKSSKEILSTDIFQRCERDTLKRILQLDLTCNEMDLFEACLLWAKKACIENDLDENQVKNIRLQLGDCFKLIRFGAMKIEEFTSIAMSNPGLFTPDEFQDTIFALTSSDYRPKIFNRNARGFIWNEESAIICGRIRESTQLRRVMTTEIIRFKANQTILLGKIMSGNTYRMEADDLLRHSNVELTIAEIGDHSHPEEIHYDGDTTLTWHCQKAQIILPKQILIKSNVVYEIRLKLQTSGESMYDYSWKPTVEMENGLKIEFQRSPAARYDTSSYGWISDLVMNRV